LEPSGWCQLLHRLVESAHPTDAWFVFNCFGLNFFLHQSEIWVHKALFLPQTCENGGKACGKIGGNKWCHFKLYPYAYDVWLCLASNNSQYDLEDEDSGVLHFL